MFNVFTNAYTGNTPAPQSGTVAQVAIGFAALEFQNYVLGLPNFWVGGEFVIQIKIVKSRGGRDLKNFNTNRYLFTGGTLFTDPKVKDLATRLAQAESRIFPNTTEFLRAIISNLDASGNTVKGQTKSFPLELRGKFAVPANDKLASPHVVVAIEKEANIGRPGVAYYRHVVTSAELDSYTADNINPPRFTDPNDFGDGFVTNFIEALKNAPAGSGLTAALPDAYGDATVGPRPIVNFRYGGIRMNDPARPKASGKSNTIKAAQQRINELAADARYVQAGDNNGPIPDSGDAVIAALKAKALQIYNSLPPEFQARIKWPAIFDQNPFTP
jgi:hypothetical protein